MAHGRAHPVAHHAAPHHAAPHHTTVHHSTPHHATVHHAAPTHHAAPVHHATPTHHPATVSHPACQPHPVAPVHQPVCAPHPVQPAQCKPVVQPNHAAVFSAAYFARKRREEEALHRKITSKTHRAVKLKQSGVSEASVAATAYDDIEKNMMSYQLSEMDDDRAESSCMPCCKR